MRHLPMRHQLLLDAFRAGSLDSWMENLGLGFQYNLMMMMISSSEENLGERRGDLWCDGYLSPDSEGEENHSVPEISASTREK